MNSGLDSSPPSGAFEISRDEAIQSLLSDESISDFKLEGNDGSVIANKAMLAARSPVFRKLLFEKGTKETEEHDDEVKNTRDGKLKVDYSSQVMKAIVEYIYTDNATVLEGDDNNNKDIKSLVPTIVALVDAATYFQLPKLCSKAEDYVTTLLSQNPLIAIPIMVACRAHGTAVSVVEGLCHNKIRSSPRVFLQTNTSEEYHLKMLSMKQIESLLQDGLFEGDELTLFFILQAWAEKGTNNETFGDGKEEEKKEEISTTSRSDNARELAKHIQFEKVDPVELAELVSPSRLVPMEQLSRAYEAQALMARRKCDITYNSPRFVDVSRGGRAASGSIVSTGRNTEILGEFISRSFNFNSTGNNNNNNISTSNYSRSVTRNSFSEQNNNNVGGINAQEILNNIPKINPLNVFAMFCPPLPQGRQESSEQRRGRRLFNSKIPAAGGVVEEDDEETDIEEEDEEEKIPPTTAHVDSEVVVIFETDDEGDDDDDDDDNGDNNHYDNMLTPHGAVTTPQKEEIVPFVIPQT